MLTSLSLFCAVVAAAYSMTSSVGSPDLYLPIFRFDGSQSEFCYPDYPSSQNDNTCVQILNENAPVFYEVDSCNGETVYTYWLWYGWQRMCIGVFDDGHGNDWEQVSVYVDSKNAEVLRVIFYQHKGYYTRGHENLNRKVTDQ